MKKEKLLRIDLMDTKEVEIVNLVVAKNELGSFVETDYDGKEVLLRLIVKEWGVKVNKYYPISRYYVCGVYEYEE